MKKLLFLLIVVLPGIAYCQKNVPEDILPSAYGIDNTGKPIEKEQLYKWLDACKQHGSRVYLPAGKYCFPVDFQYDFANTPFSLAGDGPGETIITTYDGTPSTNCAIPEKIDITKPQPVTDGIYQIDITGKNINDAFLRLSDKSLDSYVEISKGVAKSVSLAYVKSLGYITELNTTLPDPGIDGRYVVAVHELFHYTGGFEHLSLKYDTSVKYVMGTVLQRKNGKWSRYFTGAGFFGSNNYKVSGISFDNIGFYLFSPFAQSGLAPVSDNFSISDCSFKNCSRILSSMYYAGPIREPNWFLARYCYPTDQTFRFRSFSITNCDFCYIHSAIVWGPPPAEMYTIQNNNVHDCYTILTCFVLFPYSTISKGSLFNGKMSLNISNNHFDRIRTLNPGADWEVNIIKTSGNGIISNNTFTDITRIALFVCGVNTTVAGNNISYFINDHPGTYMPFPTILSKYVNEIGEISVRNNVVVNPLGDMVGLESKVSFSITNNLFTGNTRSRIISSSSADINPQNVYVVRDLNTLKRLTGGNFDPSIANNDIVYFNKRTQEWVKLQAKTSMSNFFSKVNSADGTNQYVNIIGNKIDCGAITTISASDKAVVPFQHVTIDSNTISNIMFLLVGTSVNIGTYNVRGNTFSNSDIIYTGLGAVNKLVADLDFSNNTIQKDPAHYCNLSAATVLNFDNNIITDGKAPSGTRSQYDYAVVLNGASRTAINAEYNKFSNSFSRQGCLEITTPATAKVDNNQFDLTQVQPSSQSQAVKAVFLKTDNAESIDFSNNKIITAKNVITNVVEFDNETGKVGQLKNTNNSVTDMSNVQSIISAHNKSVGSYTSEKNSYSNKDDIGSSGK